MLKLISLNMEGERHIERIIPFLSHESADVVCLMEAPEFFQVELSKMGYSTYFTPMLGRNRSGMSFLEGILIASKHPQTSSHEYYYRMSKNISFCTPGEKETISFPVCFATIETNDETYEFASLHMPVTPDGYTNDEQTAAVQNLLEILTTRPPHFICGDFNMPRGFNTHYKTFLKNYTDTVPKNYGSSLDRNIHRLGNDPTLNAPIFDEFMVDYIFTQSPYTARDVRLEFGVSDHAAVVGTIEKQT